MKITSANGVTGQLIYSHGSSGEHYFRVYGHDGSFKDYVILHCDLTITINDEDAAFYEDGKTLILDHSPATLGRTYD